MVVRCITNETAHYERHLAIARLVAEVRSWDSGAEQQSQMPSRGRKRGGRKEDGSEGDDLSTTNDESTITIIDVSSSDNKPINGGHDTDFDDADEKFMSPSERRALKKTLKDRRNQEKAFRNQQRFTPSVSRAHVDRVARVIHGAQWNVDGIGGQPRTQENDADTVLRRNDAYNAAIKEHRSWLKVQVRGSRARSGKKGVEAKKRQNSEDVQNGLLMQEQDVEELVSGILTQLGISGHDDAHSTMNGYANTPTPGRNRKHKAGTVLQLRREIMADIEKSENERRARQQRMEGYWRYVNGTVTDRLTRNARSVDRATGVKLKGDGGRRRSAPAGQAEEAELEADVDGDRGAEATNLRP